MAISLRSLLALALFWMSAAAQSVVKFKLKPIAPQECAASASELGALVGLDEVRVVFRGGAKNQEAHEKAGLHLWYQGVASSCREYTGAPPSPSGPQGREGSHSFSIRA